METIMITGATGFTGNAVAKELIRRGHRVIGVVRDPARIVPSLRENQQFVPLQYKGTSSSLLLGLDDVKVDAIFHLATHTSITPDADECQTLVQANVIFGLHLLQVMKELDCEIFINTSTYWQLNHVGEPAPMNEYAATKQLFEEILWLQSAPAGLVALTLYLYDTYGPEDTRGKIFSLLMQAERTNLRLNMTQGNQIIHPVHIDDVCRAFWEAYLLAKASSKGTCERYFVAGEGVTLRDFVERWAAARDTKLDVLWGVKPYKPKQIMVPFVGERLPGWKPKIDLEGGLARL